MSPLGLIAGAVRPSTRPAWAAALRAAAAAGRGAASSAAASCCSSGSSLPPGSGWLGAAARALSTFTAASPTKLEEVGGDGGCQIAGRGAAICALHGLHSVWGCTPLTGACKCTCAPPPLPPVRSCTWTSCATRRRTRLSRSGCRWGGGRRTGDAVAAASTERVMALKCRKPPAYRRTGRLLILHKHTYNSSTRTPRSGGSRT